MNERDFITSIRDQCNAFLGGNADPNPNPPPGSITVPPITSKPQPFADIGFANGDPAQTPTQALAAVAVDFSMRANSYSRALKFFPTQGGKNWNRCSWAIFDTGGGKVFGEDNILPAGTLGYGVPETYLAQLGAGRYTLAVALDVGSTSNGPQLGFQVNQAGG